MPLIDANYNVITKQYRCGMADCGKVICAGSVIQGRLVVRCKCGIDNRIPELEPAAVETRLHIAGRPR